MYQNLKTVGLIILIVSSLCLLGCNERQPPNRQAWSPTEPSTCTKLAEGEKATPLYKKRGGDEVRESLKKGTPITVLRTKEGWNLVRVKGTKASGWLKARNVGACPSKKAATKASR